MQWVIGIIVVVILVAAIVLGRKGILIVPQAKVAIIERLGKFQKVAHSGVNFVNPLWSKAKVINPDDYGPNRFLLDLAEKYVDLPSQEVITKDNVNVDVDSVIYYQIMDPVKAVYELRGLDKGIEHLAVTTTRNVIGELTLDETLTSRDTINKKLRKVLDDATDKWGVRVGRIELKNIETKGEVEDAMRKQMQAERSKRATILEAEGKKQAMILEAEGRKEAVIMEAEAKKEALIREAIGEAEAIKMVFNAIKESQPTQEVITIKYLEALKEIADGKSTKIFMPYEATQLLSSAGAIKEMISKK